MRSFSDVVSHVLPATLAVVLLAFFTVPMRAGSVSLCPNVGMLATLIIASLYPPAWPRWFALLFGLLQDVVFHTPLGVHAILLVMLVSAGERVAQRGFQPFRMRWFDAAGIIAVWHLMLWLLLHLAQHHAPSILLILQAAIVTALWYPVFYIIFSRIGRLD